DCRLVPVPVHPRELLLAPATIGGLGATQLLVVSAKAETTSPNVQVCGYVGCLTPRPPRNPDTSANVGAYAPTCSQATAAAAAANAAWSSSAASGRLITLTLHPAILASPPPTLSSTR